MADERSEDFPVVDALGRSRARRRVNPFAPGCPSASEQPLEDAGPALRHVGCAITWIEKIVAVEMIGSRPAIKWHLGLGCAISPWRRSPSELRRGRAAPPRRRRGDQGRPDCRRARPAGGGGGG